MIAVAGRAYDHGAGRIDGSKVLLVIGNAINLGVMVAALGVAAVDIQDDKVDAAPEGKAHVGIMR